MRDVTFIIPNRGGKNINRVIKNFELTFYPYFDSIKFIVINQDDDKPFKRGQLYNIAIDDVDTEYVGLIDNDVINRNSFDPIEEYYNNGESAYICFDKITHIKYEGESIEEVYSVSGLSGFGAFGFMKTSDFIYSGGFSNLCSAWGREDDIFNMKIKFSRISNELYHIQHPKRNADCPLLLDYNTKIMRLYMSNDINHILDGYAYTTCDVLYNVVENDVRYIGVRNIRVSDDFEYMDLFNEMGEVEKVYMNDGISICVTAYKSKEYISETLESIKNQIWFEHNDAWECLIGIDGCDETYEYCKSIMNMYDSHHFKFFLMDSNKGTYITTNTLMSIAQYNNLIRFDSDDIMPDDFIERIMQVKEDYDYMRVMCKNFGLYTCSFLSWGVCFIRKDIFLKYGGYMPWICAGDYELGTRMKLNCKVKENNDIYYLRRAHEGSLQYSLLTNADSDIRKNYHRYVENETPIHPIIECVTTTFSEIYNKHKYENENSKSCSGCVIYDNYFRETKKIKCLVLDNKSYSKAKTIHHAFSEYFPTRLIDVPYRTYSILYSDMDEYIENSDFVILIKSNVSFDYITNNEFLSIVDKLKACSNDRELGVYSVSFKSGVESFKSRCLYSDSIREVDEVSDQFVMIRSSLLYGNSLNFNNCQSGAGFIEYICQKSKKLGYKNYVDDTFIFPLYTNIEHDDNYVFFNEKNIFIKNNDM